jgi:hypothetical protein
MANLEVEFNEQKTIVVVQEQSVTIDKIVIREMIDRPNERVVYVYTEGIPGVIKLWEGDEYDTIGDWTNQDVIDKINEIYS